MALPTVPTAVLSSVAETEMGKAAGINYMAQRFGAAIAIAGVVFSAHGNLSNPAAVTSGFQPALWCCVIFAALAALTSVAITPRTSGTSTDTHPVGSRLEGAPGAPAPGHRSGTPVTASGAA